MPSIIIVLLMITLYAHICVSFFLEGTSKLPRACDSLSVGYDFATDTILIVGGSPNTRQFVTFKDHTFTDESRLYLSDNETTEGWSQHYTQLGNELWMIQNTDHDTRFTIFNTETYTATSSSMMIPTTVSSYGCLTSIDGYLIVVGGLGTSILAETQIYRFSDSEWFSNVPSLNKERQSFSCVVSANKVYAIGGDDGNTYLDSIETLDISNIDTISTQTWDNTWAKPLISGRKGTRSVVYGSDIFVSGGKNNAGSRVSDINVIDTLTGNVAVGDTLAVAVSYGSSIIVGNMLYVFGGWSSNDVSAYIDTYQYSTLPTLPTMNPTANPIVQPTVSPSIPPTSNPSTAPSVNPSAAPTFDPSTAPTFNPSTAPTFNPSTAPTFNPSTAPTFNPSTAPTIDSTITSTIPIDAVVTQYDVSVKFINCESTNCEIPDDDWNDIIEATLSVDANVEIIGTEIAKDIVVIHLSITTNSDNILDTDIITSHIEKEIENNNNFGDVKTEQVEETDNNFNESPPFLSKTLIMIILIVITVITSTLLMICIYSCLRKKQETVLTVMPDTATVVPKLERCLSDSTNTPADMDVVKASTSTFHRNKIDNKDIYCGAVVNEAEDVEEDIEDMYGPENNVTTHTRGNDQNKDTYDREVVNEAEGVEEAVNNITTDGCGAVTLFSN